MSSSDDGASRLSETLDEVMGTSASSSWSIDDEPENGSAATSAAGVADAEPATPIDPESAGAVRDDTGELDWSVDDLPPDTDDVAPPPERFDDGVLEARDIAVPDHDDDSLPAGEAGFVLPEIVQATADIADESDAATSPGPAGSAPVTHPGAPLTQTPVVSAPAVIPVNPVPAAPAPMPATSTGWHEHVPTARAGSTRTPTRRPRVRRVTRVLRHIDPWSTFKLALLFSLVAYVSVLTSGVLLWRVADTTGALDNVERWFTQFGWETFEFKGGEIFHNAWIIGLFGVVFATGGAVLLVTLFNLVSDIIGGVRVTVLEEEVVERTVSSNRRYVVRRPGSVDAVADSAAVPAWSLDDVGEPASGASPVDSAAAEAPVEPAPVDDWSIDDDPSPAPTVEDSPPRR